MYKIKYFLFYFPWNDIIASKIAYPKKEVQQFKKYQKRSLRQFQCLMFEVNKKKKRWDLFRVCYFYNTLNDNNKNTQFSLIDSNSHKHSIPKLLEILVFHDLQNWSIKSSIMHYFLLGIPTPLAYNKKRDPYYTFYIIQRQKKKQRIIKFYASVTGNYVRSTWSLVGGVV